MIRNLEIENFKSIKYLKLECKRINLFIGEPNTGKSNILETIALLSHICHEGNICDFIRFENMMDLFYDRILENKVKILFDEKELWMSLENEKYSIYAGEKGIYCNISRYNHEGLMVHRASSRFLEDFRKFKFYRFRVRSDFPNKRSDFLNPPDGDNLFAVVVARKDLRSILKQIFGSFGLTLAFELHENKIRVQKQLEEDIVISFPYSLASETIQRLVFYLTAIYSNKNSVLAFEEPEAHAFPYYTKYLAEIIAQNKNNNQYFISTHNPYFLLSALEKAPKDEVAVFCTRLEDYQTKVKALTEEQIGEILEKGIDIFLNVKRFLEGA
ncbi:MAG: AAA family ATPase [Candidatus Bathyarchaeia archaeon]